MIKANVEVKNKSWYKKIKNPKKYFNKKLKKISKIVPFFKKKKRNFYHFINEFIKYDKTK